MREHPCEENASVNPDFREEKEELERVLAHPEISRSANLVRFLSFICRKYFEGKAEDIRECTIAVEALGRKESTFDSHVDPIVRVTARALRKRLGEYYQNGGKSSPIQILLPVGRYVPQFVRPASGSTHQDPVAEAPQLEADQEENPASEIISPPLEEKESERVDLTDPEKGFGQRRDWKKIWTYLGLGISLSVVFGTGFFLGRRSQNTLPVNVFSLQWGEPVWSDEFDGAPQQTPDPSKWTSETGKNGGWGNHEIETNCSASSGLQEGCNPRHPNAFLDGQGHLVLRAIRAADGTWTSARVTTRDVKDFLYGRIEARMKLPVGVGLWPSFWMLGSDFPTVGWPASGSVDLIENVSVTPHNNGVGPTMIRSTLHGPRYYRGNGLWHDFKLPNGARVDDSSFHTYGIIWSPQMIQFYVDDPANVYFVRGASDIPEGGKWVFDHPFFLIMNLAVGGDWAGDPDATTPSPADMLVDYVRVYKIPHVSAPALHWQAVPVKAGSTTTSILNLHAGNGTGRVYLSCSTQPATVVCSLGNTVVDFSDTLNQEDTVTLSTDTFTADGRMAAAPGIYKLTITATSISGDRSQLNVPFEVKGGK